MGQYFILVNTTKKQYVDIDELGENNKFGYVGQGLNGIVLARLACSPGHYLDYGDPDKDEIYVGLWAGDNIIIAGDYDKETFDKKYGELNLYARVKIDPDYENITDKIIDWLTRDDLTLTMLQERAINDKVLNSKLRGLTKNRE